MTTPRQITIRGPSEALARRLKATAEERGESLNATILRLLEEAVGIDRRRAWLESWATWTDADLAEFERELRHQRVVDADLWR